jgi:hypothetical protein
MPEKTTAKESPGEWTIRMLRNLASFYGKALLFILWWAMADVACGMMRSQSSFNVTIAVVVLLPLLVFAAIGGIKWIIKRVDSFMSRW